MQSGTSLRSTILLLWRWEATKSTRRSENVSLSFHHTLLQLVIDVRLAKTSVDFVPSVRHLHFPDQVGDLGALPQPRERSALHGQVDSRGSSSLDWAISRGDVTAPKVKNTNSRRLVLTRLRADHATKLLPFLSACKEFLAKVRSGCAAGAARRRRPSVVTQHPSAMPNPESGER